MTMIKIQVPTVLTEDGMAFRALAIEAAVRNMTTYTIDDGVNCVYEQLKPNSFFFTKFNPQTVAGVIQAGGSVEGYQCFMKMSKAYAEVTDVPVGFPLSTKVLEDEVIVQKKWIEYTPFHEISINSVDYIVKEDTDGRVFWSGDIIAQCYAIPEIEVLTIAEFKALTYTNEQTV